MNLARYFKRSTAKIFVIQKKKKFKWEFVVTVLIQSKAVQVQEVLNLFLAKVGHTRSRIRSSKISRSVVVLSSTTPFQPLATNDIKSFRTRFVSFSSQLCATVIISTSSVSIF